jgi:hypothetical protein
MASRSKSQTGRCSACISNRFALAGLFALAAVDSSAQGRLVPDAVFVESGAGRQAREATLGLGWNTSRAWSLATGRVTLGCEAFASSWSYPAAAGEGASASRWWR